MKVKLFKRIVVSLSGLIICGIGISLFLMAGLGVDPASVFQLGISNVFKITYGTASALMNLIIILIVFIVDKSYINISTILAIFAIGYTADLSMNILQNIFNELSIFANLFFIICGEIVMCIGVVIYIGADLGVGAIDSISELISNKKNIEYKKIRIMVDLFFIIAGYLMGGVVGIGTIVCALATGPLIQFFRPIINNKIKEYLN